MKCYNYYYTKQLIAIAFSKNPKQYFNNAHLSEKYLEFLYQKIVLCDFTMINEQMKYNLFELVNHIRFNGNLSNEKIELLNEIITKINSSEISFYKYQGYLAEEYDIRMPDGEFELDFLDDGQIDELLENIELDFMVLKSLLCDESEYENIVFPDLILNEFYFGSINKLKEEVPALVYKKMDRIMEVIFINRMYKKRKYKNTIEGYNKKMLNRILKEGDKMLKKMKK